jgi:hypothetical protein
MGLFANIPAVEANQTMVMARAIAVAMGDAKTLAHCVYLSTGDAKMAQQVEIRAQMQKAMNG